MGFFGSKKKEVIDFTQYKKPQSKSLVKKEESVITPISSSDNFSFFNTMTEAGNQHQEAMASVSESNDPEERKRALSKKLSDITNRLEEMSTNIYHLQQRVELIEKKMNVNRF